MGSTSAKCLATLRPSCSADVRDPQILSTTVLAARLSFGRLLTNHGSLARIPCPTAGGYARNRSHVAMHANKLVTPAIAPPACERSTSTVGAVEHLPGLPAIKAPMKHHSAAGSAILHSTAGVMNAASVAARANAKRPHDKAANAKIGL